MILGKLQITANVGASFLRKQLFPYVVIAVNKCIWITARENLSSVFATTNALTSLRIRTVVCEKRTEDLMLSGRSFMKLRNRTGSTIDPWGTPDSTGTGSDAWPSKTTR